MVTTKNILLELDKAFVDEIITEGGLKLYLDPSWNPEWNASVTGKVAAIPRIASGSNKAAIGNLKVGDEVAFSYTVVSEKTYGSNDNVFHPLSEGNPFKQDFLNGLGSKINVTAFQGRISKVWSGVLLDKKGNVLDGAEGNESDISRWLAQFDFTGDDEGSFKNLYELNNKDYWYAEPLDLLAKKEGDTIVAIGDYHICTPIDTDLTTRFNLSQGLSLPPMSVRARFFDRATVVAGVDGYKEGDVLAFSERMINKYELWGKQYFLIPKNQVSGIWTSN